MVTRLKPADDGEFVLDDAGSFVGYWEYKSLFDRHHEAQAEIARLQAELVEANSCHETALSLANFGAGQITRLQAEVERLTAVNEVRESQANMLGAIRDTAWNEAIEAALSELHWLCADDKAAIRALKHPKE